MAWLTEHFCFYLSVLCARQLVKQPQFESKMLMQAVNEEAPQADAEPQQARSSRGGWRRVARNVVKRAAAVAVACAVGAVGGSLAASVSRSQR